MQNSEHFVEQIPGATALINWFGYWPSFHDAEILQLHLDRAETSKLIVHTWRMTNQVDEKGFYVLDKHVHVTFTFDSVTDLQLSEFNHQNVISGLGLTKFEEEFEIELQGCFGMCGSIKGCGLRIEIAQP